MKPSDRSLRNFAMAMILVIFSLLPTVTLADPFTDHEDFKPTATSPLVHILKSDGTGLTFELNTRPFTVTDDGSIEVPGLEHRVVEAGSPALPFFSTFVAIPPNAEVSVAVEASNTSSHNSLYVIPAPQRQLKGEIISNDEILTLDAGSMSELSPLFIEDPAVYDLDAKYPGVTNEISEPMYWRDLRMAELKLFPLQYSPMRKTVTQASKLIVHIKFTGSQLDAIKSLPRDKSTQTATLRKNVINFEQGRLWRSFPDGGAVLDTLKLPVGVQTFKIEVDRDGIYEVSGAELAALGFRLPADPDEIQMMQGGSPVTYQFVDTNSNQSFDTVDKIRFYGWAFAGSRREKLYVSDNVYWLWSGGEASQISTTDNLAGNGPVVTAFRDSVTKWQERHYSSGYAIEWDVNDPTAWHTRRLSLFPLGTEHTEDIDLFNPVADSGEVSYLVEITTQYYQDDPVTFEVQTFLNNSPNFGKKSWMGPKNLNVINTVNADVLKQPGDEGYPTNQVMVKFSSSAKAPIPILITRFTIDYMRELEAISNQLIFGNEEAGQNTYRVSGFSSGNPSEALVWDISNPHAPLQIKMQAQNIVGNADNYTYHIGRNHGPDASFIATTVDNIMAVKSLSTYEPVSIHPPSGGARWLAITHSSLSGAADELAAYRQRQMSAFVVNIEDVVNQIGYGFHTPETIRQYLRAAVSEWGPAPDYVILFGDATNNPRHLECSDCNKNWRTDAPNLIATDFKFVDRWQGMIPSDFALSLLFGDDLIADVAISRMPANTFAEASRMVQKVIGYESQRAENPEAWQRNILFIADNPDNGGNFPAENIKAALLVPDTYNKTELQLDVPDDAEFPTVAEVNELRSQMRTQINDIGGSILNYRGHGSVSRWGGYNNEPPILSADDVDLWENYGRSMIILSADCLDGYFVQNYESGLGETFMRLNNRGSVAHWSSSGLGYSSEHSILHQGFYEGLFKSGQIALGDAANFAKIEYYQSGNHPSELYSFTLLGDAAMEAVSDERRKAFLPLTIAQ